jgi:hypothetical protein
MAKKGARRGWALRRAAHRTKHVGHAISLALHFAGRASKSQENSATGDPICYTLGPDKPRYAQRDSARCRALR